jgi:hypothetical protein
VSQYKQPEKEAKMRREMEWNSLPLTDQCTYTVYLLLLRIQKLRERSMIDAK